MTDIEKDSQDEWKIELRSNLITALNSNGDQQERKNADEQIGYFYQCCAPASLFKYYSNETRNFEAVINGKMWYSTPQKFNDVFDSDIIIDENEIFNCALGMSPDKREIHAGSQMWNQIKKVIHQQTGSLRRELERLRSSMGISCMSELENSLLMWAHYANNHHGICVEYNLMKINKQLNFTPVPIVYTGERACFRSLNIATIKKDVQKVYIEGITSKSTEWGYEKEWRIIRDETACGDLWDKNQKGALLDMIRPDSIILGCEAERDFEKTVREYCEANRIDLYKMEKDKAQYRINKKTLLRFNSI